VMDCVGRTERSYGSWPVLDPDHAKYRRLLSDHSPALLAHRRTHKRFRERGGVGDLVFMLLVEHLVAADDKRSPLIGCGIANRHLAPDVDLIRRVALDELGVVLHLDVLLEPIRERRPDIARARELLDWQPKVGVREGLLRTIAYFEDNVIEPQGQPTTSALRVPQALAPSLQSDAAD
jgi:hypothetical protein